MKEHMYETGGTRVPWAGARICFSHALLNFRVR